MWTILGGCYKRPHFSELNVISSMVHEEMDQFTVISRHTIFKTEEEEEEEDRSGR